MSKPLTLGSIFDGIGAFPLAGIQAGIIPVWASEIEPFPIRVTAKRLPGMKHYGDIRNLRGHDLESADIISFGSPCTDVSISGKQAGIHGAQSSLFFEAVRVIKEMRESTNGKYPRWLVFENVPNAMSCGAGNDFREILESLVRIKEPEATIPMPDGGKWLPAGEIRGRAALGSDYSLAWRVLDAAKGWGVAQRRKRIFLICDLGGQRAGSVLFESEGLSKYTPPDSPTRQGDPGTAAPRAGTAGCGSGGAVAFEPGLLRRKGGHVYREISGTLRSDPGDNLMSVAMPRAPVAFRIGADWSYAMLSDNPRAGVSEAEVCRTLDRHCGDPVCHQGGMAVVTSVCHAQTFPNDKFDVVSTPDDIEYIVRKLTPGESCLLMGFPPGWTEGLGTESPTDDEIHEWTGIFEEWYRAQGKQVRPLGIGRIRKWLRDPRSNTAEYKAYGNSVVVPCVFFVLAGIVWAMEMEGSDIY